LSQFARAQEDRLDAFSSGFTVGYPGGVSVEMKAALAGPVTSASRAHVNLNVLRGWWWSGLNGGTPSILQVPAWAVLGAVVDGAEPVDYLALDPAGTGFITPTFLARINTILDDAGCPPMGTSVLGSGTEGFHGIPWTRKSGSAAAPTVGYGLVTAGDIIGRHIFNEAWALFMALDCVVETDAWSPPWTRGFADGESATNTGTGATSGDALTAMVSGWPGSPSSGPDLAPSANAAVGGSFDATGTRQSSRAEWAGLGISGAGTSAKVFWLPQATAGGFTDHDDEGKAEGVVAYTESVTVTAGATQTQIRGSTTAPLPIIGGYSLAPRIALAMAFPDP
jgi:hypothetical protein